jgi:hypothetical protein
MTQPLVNPVLIEWKLGGYGVAPASALRDETAWLRAQEYRRVVSARMQPIEPKELRGRLPAGEYHVSRKVDGEFTVLCFYDGEICTVNPGGTVRVGLPLLAEAKARLQAQKVRSALIAGELCYRRPDGGRERIQDICRVARRPESQDDLDRLCFAAFDIIDLDGAPAPARFAETFARIEQLFAGGDRVRPVPSASALARTAEEIERHFQSLVTDAGGEGLVLRSDSFGRFKVKERHTLDVAVIGFTEYGDERRGMLHDLLVAVMRPDGALHILGRVGNGFSDDERRSLLADLSGRVVGSDYVHPSSDRLAYKLVRPEVVVEISCLDLISHTSRGSAVENMTLEWNETARRYRPLAKLPLASLFAPVFLRRRDDKRVDVQDVRLAQVTALVDIGKTDVRAQDIVRKKSQLLRREVYVKAGKASPSTPAVPPVPPVPMIRKLLLWQTGKEETGDFPAYVLHLTDFSPNRKEPLERQIRVSSSLEQIESLWAALHKEYIVRGWTRA